MYNSQTTSNDLNLSFPAAFKHEKVEFHKTREAMASDLCHQQQLNSSLMRFRSAPSTLIANFMDEDFVPRSTSPEAESMFARFMSCGGGDSASPDLHEIGEKPLAAAAASQRNSQFITGIEHEAEVVPQQNGFASASQMMYQTNPLPNHSSATVSGIESSYRNSMAVDTAQVKSSSSNCSNLIRHSSSPAGLFANLTVENSYGVMRGMGSFRGGNGINGETTASASRFKNQRSLLSRQASSPGQMSQISEMGSESLGGSSPDDGSLGNANGTGRIYIPGGFPISSWNDSSLENFTGVKGVRDVNGKMISSLNPSEAQNGEGGNNSHGLTHQFSLPKTSSELAAVDKFMQFQDSVPCKIRAKRGCATHPRSIAERVRRTRISERMRKLQELVPNMDKQTNTADMLDLAVEYIKDLQRQVKTFSDNRASCSCPSKQKPYSKPTV